MSWRWGGNRSQKVDYMHSMCRVADVCGGNKQIPFIVELDSGKW